MSEITSFCGYRIYVHAMPIPKSLRIGRNVLNLPGHEVVPLIAMQPDAMGRLIDEITEFERRQESNDDHDD